MLHKRSRPFRLPQGTPLRYSKAVQLVHEFSGALLCIDAQERAESESFAVKVVLKTLEPSSGVLFRLSLVIAYALVILCRTPLRYIA